MMTTLDATPRLRDGLPRSGARTSAAWMAATLVFCVIAAFAGLSMPHELPFRAFGPDDVGQTLLVLFVASLLMERAVEVFVVGLRQAGDERRAKELSALNLAGVTGDLLMDAERDCADYKAQTRRGVIIAMTIAGVLLAAFGVRALHMLVDADALAGLPELQRGAFLWADIALTGGVIAGGSEAIHKLTEAYSSAMKAITK